MTLLILFWGAALFITYTYVGYPVLIALLARLRPQVSCPLLDDDGLPRVTVVMAGYNEAARLPGKIANLRALDYPQDKVDILVVSDGSTDATTDVLGNLAGVRVLAYPQRQGKAHALNLALAQVQTEFVVFCDVRQDLEAGSVRRLMSDFCDPTVGAVSGELVHRPSSTQAGQNIGLYWRYEKAIRKAESRFSFHGRRHRRALRHPHPRFRADRARHHPRRFRNSHAHHPHGQTHPHGSASPRL